MRQPKLHNLWFVFVFSTFLVMVAIVMAFAGGLFLIIRPDLRGLIEVPIGPLVFLFITSAIIGSVLSTFVGRRILKPIMKLSEATKQVAAGDFTVRLKTWSNVREIADLYKNFDTMVRELGSTEALRSDFMDNVSHELRTPLGMIEGYAQLLCDEQLGDADRREYASSIIQSARQLSQLSSNILKISKLENQQIIVRKTRFMLDEQIRRVLLALEPMWSMKDIAFELDMDEAEIEGSEELMQQVWQNLLANAIKFSPERGRIFVKLISSPSNVLVMIRDEGIGMADDEQRHIFDKFYQADRTRGSDGNGLGLTLTKRIIDISGGTISVHSQPSKGSTFAVSLKHKCTLGTVQQEANREGSG